MTIAILSPDQFRNQHGTKRKLQTPRSTSVWVDGYAELMDAAANLPVLGQRFFFFEKFGQRFKAV